MGLRTAAGCYPEQVTDHKSSGGWLLSSPPPRRVRIARVVTSQKAARQCILAGLLLVLWSSNFLRGWELPLQLLGAACLVWAYWLSYYHRTDQ